MAKIKKTKSSKYNNEIALYKNLSSLSFSLFFGKIFEIKAKNSIQTIIAITITAMIIIKE